MELEAQFAGGEGRFHPLDERRIGVKPGDLVFVLVGHQLEQITRHRFRKGSLARHLRGLRRDNLVDKGTVLPRVARTLISGEEDDTARHDLVEALRQPQ